MLIYVKKKLKKAFKKFGKAEKGVTFAPALEQRSLHIAIGITGLVLSKGIKKKYFSKSLLCKGK
ncbi:hypothetical protein, partial [Flavobacterium rhizosphaerae]